MHQQLNKEGNQTTVYGVKTDEYDRFDSNNSNGVFMEDKIKLNARRKWLCCIFISLITIAAVATTITLVLKNQSTTSNNQPRDIHHLCLWNATNSSYLNGIYASDGVSQSQYARYSLTDIQDSCNISGNTIYLFNSMEAIWTLSTSMDEQLEHPTTNELQGICTSNAIQNVTNCNGLWEIPYGHPQQDVTIKYSPQCPTLSCRGLHLYYDEFIQNETCIGTFNNKIQSNMYQKGASDIYLYFDSSIFRWVCVDISGNKDILNQQCLSLNNFDGYSIEQSWFNADLLSENGKSITMKWSNGHDAILECLDTPLPTSYPTLEPTSPTIEPTRSPTADVGGCFSSDSFVYIYPNYTKISVNELEIFDKILTYDALNDNFIWDEILTKVHFIKDEYLNNELMEMIEFILENNETLTITSNHLLYVNNNGLIRADKVVIGDLLTYFDSNHYLKKKRNILVIDINKNDILKYPRDLFTYNGNLVINGVAISSFTDTIWGESEYFGQFVRFIMKYCYSFNIWRYPFYFVTKLWNEYLSYNVKEYILQFRFSNIISDTCVHHALFNW